MIHYDIPKPELSPDFTIDDIHKIREWHYEMLKDATTEEQINFYHEGSKRVQAMIEARRREKQQAAQP
ncbi:MAG: hypothetical protein Pg6C_05760 [Treponemataceae bacterium]|nr:MAG: hypothetical protein Pg6C_05760 [Treponemataceae bacterium]